MFSNNDPTFTASQRLQTIKQKITDQAIKIVIIIIIIKIKIKIITIEEIKVKKKLQ